MSSGLAVDTVTVRYGGHVAVDAVSLVAEPGRITGLIGPNGAGKTSFFNACSGLVPHDGGTVALDGVDLTSASPTQRARRGLGRTFQRMELFDSLTVAENVALAHEAALAGGNPLRHLLARPSDGADVRERARQALDQCGIADLADRRTGTLPTGQRRLVELARVLAADFRILLLDEPSSGLDATETERFGTILRQVVNERGVGILIVEHDMALVMGICATVYVLDFGELIFSGTPAEVLASPAVRAAYLGSTELEVA
jgi:ABC-type branched-subunit amino acid transport system ATPase component